MKPKETIKLFDDFLKKRGLSLDAVVIGGTALALLGVVSRQTRDCDVLDPKIPEEMVLAAREFATHRREAGELLDDDWFNNGPASLVRQLPAGWRERPSIFLSCSGRSRASRALGLSRLPIYPKKNACFSLRCSSMKLLHGCEPNLARLVCVPFCTWTKSLAICHRRRIRQARHRY